MTKSFDDIVSNFKDPRSEWEVFVNGEAYNEVIELLEFRQSLNSPVEFTVRLKGLPEGVEIPEDAEVVIKKSGLTVLRGVAQEFKPDSFNQYQLKGAGYSAELEGDSKEIVEAKNGVSNPFKSSSVTEIVDTLIDGATINTASQRVFSTNYSLDNSLSVDDFRANSKQLEDVNRLMGEYGIEWYLSFDGSNNPVFNVTDQIQNDDGGGGSIGTLKTYGSDQTAEKVNQNVNRNKGSFDGVKVRGYGDGDDQITASAGSIGKDSRVLIYTDKTILSPSQAQKRADAINEYKTVAWQEIEVKPNNPNALYSIGDLLTVDSEKAYLSDDYRVVESYYKIWPGENQFESKLNLSNKPQTFLSEFQGEKAKRESQTDYSQGNRNTINENNSSIADSEQGLEIDLNIPQAFVEDEANNDRTAQVLLDYKVKDYNRLIPFGDSASAVNDKTPSNPVLTSINNFGNLEREETEPLSLDPNNDETSTRWLGEDSDFENTGEGTVATTQTYKASETERGTKFISSLDLPSTGNFAEGVNFSESFDSDPVVTATLETLDNGDFVDVRHHISEVTPSGFTLRGYAATDASGDPVSVRIHYQASNSIGDSSIVLSAEVPEPPSASGFDSGRKELAGVSFAATVTNNSGEFQDFDVEVSHPDFTVSTDNNSVSDGNVYNLQNTVVDSGIDVGDTVTATISASDGLFTDEHSSRETSVGLFLESVSDQKHTVEQADAANDNVKAYSARNGDTRLDAGKSGEAYDFTNNTDEEVPDNSTKNIDEIGGDELIVEKRETDATSVDIYVDDGSGFTQVKSGLSLNEENIDLTDDVSQGKNVVEVRPDKKAEVQGNIIVDHKIAGERQ